MDKIKLHWEERGSGEPLVLLHGNGEDCTVFEKQMAHFSKKYRVIAVDTRGHGKSPRGTAPFTFRTFAYDLRDFLEEHDLGKVHLLGFSDGGNLALTFALRWPECLRSLIVDGANLDPSGLKSSFLLPCLLACAAAKVKVRFLPQLRPRLELLTLIVEEPDISPESLGEIHVPTLVMAGTDDIIRDEHTRLIHRSIPGSRLAIVRGDHFIAMKKSRLFNRAVDDFLDRLPPEGKEEEIIDEVHADQMGSGQA